MRKVNLQFGGQVAVTWETLSAAIDAYRDIAAHYGLVMPRGAFIPVFEHNTDDLIGLQVRWEKRGLGESAIQIFNETWYAISVQYGIVRFDTVVSYYEE